MIKSQLLAEISLNNDFMFSAVFSDLSICKVLLEKLLSCCTPPPKSRKLTPAAKHGAKMLAAKYDKMVKASDD